MRLGGEFVRPFSGRFGVGCQLLGGGRRGRGDGRRSEDRVQGSFLGLGALRVVHHFDRLRVGGNPDVYPALFPVQLVAGHPGGEADLFSQEGRNRKAQVRLQVDVLVVVGAVVVNVKLHGPVGFGHAPAIGFRVVIFGRGQAAVGEHDAARHQNAGFHLQVSHGDCRAGFAGGDRFRRRDAQRAQGVALGVDFVAVLRSHVRQREASVLVRLGDDLVEEVVGIVIDLRDADFRCRARAGRP